MFKSPRILLFAITACAMNAQWNIVPQPDTRVELLVEKTGLMSGKKHVFQFTRYEGRLSYDPSKLESTTLNLRLEAAALKCEDTWVSAKDLKKIEALAQDEILQTSKHPAITFQLLSLKPGNSGEAQAAGQVTLRGITKPVAFPVTYSAKPAELLIKGTAKVKLTDFQIKPPTAALGAVGTKDEMLLNFNLKATPAPSR
jgi:polyisoprenoid-binding protein YceI